MSEFRAASTTTADPLASFPDVVGGDAPILAQKTADQGPMVFEAVNGFPLTAQHFDMKTFWDSPTAEIQREQIRSLDDWIKEKVQERKMTDSQDSYQEIINGILKQIGKSDNEKPQATFERVYNAVEAFKRLEAAKLPTILDVNSMTPSEYKKTRA